MQRREPNPLERTIFVSGGPSLCPLARYVGEFMSHAVHPRCKVLQFLHIRAASIRLYLSFTRPLLDRWYSLCCHSQAAIREYARKVIQSGWMRQGLFCYGMRKPGEPMPLPLGDTMLRYDKDRGVPIGMTQEYFDKGTMIGGRFGWFKHRSKDGTFSITLNM